MQAVLQQALPTAKRGRDTRILKAIAQCDGFINARTDDLSSVASLKAQVATILTTPQKRPPAPPPVAAPRRDASAARSRRASTAASVPRSGSAPAGAVRS